MPMAERTILVCDICGELAVETVTVEVKGLSLQRDLCQPHLTMLTADVEHPAAGTPRGTRPSFYPRVVRSEDRVPNT
jgi:hypothetical protein